MNFPETVGRPTMGALLAHNGLAVQQSLASQAAWFIDPINGRNSNNGKTLATAIQTRTEFYRRMAGVTLTQIVSITITSSLLAGDVGKSVVFSGPFTYLKFIGVPIILFTGAITGIVNRNGATSTHTSMTIAGLPVSWTASGLVGKIVQAATGTIRESIVVQDEAAKTAWLSPPMSRTGVESTFTNGETVTVYDCPSLGTNDTIETGFGQIWYLGLKINGGKFYSYNSEIVIQSCIGDCLFYDCHSTSFNCYTGVVPTQSYQLYGGGAAEILGGFHRLITSEGGTFFVGPAATIYAINCETGGRVAGRISPGTGGDLEFCATQANIPAIYFPFPEGSFISSRYVYGIVNGTAGIQFDQMGSRAQFANLPTWTGTNADLILGPGGVVASIASTGVGNYLDTSYNLVSTPAGDGFGGNNPVIALQKARGLLAETIPQDVQLGAGAPVSGTLYFQQIFLQAGQVLTTSHINTGFLGVLVTFGKIGLYNTAGALLIATADQGAAWATLGRHSQNFTAPFTVPTTGIYYMGILCLATTTMPRWAAIMSPSVNNVGLGEALAGKPLYYGSQTGLTDLPNPMTVAIGTAPAKWWIGLS